MNPEDCVDAGYAVGMAEGLNRAWWIVYHALDDNHNISPSAVMSAIREEQDGWDSRIHELMQALINQYPAEAEA